MRRGQRSSWASSPGASSNWPALARFRFIRWGREHGGPGDYGYRKSVKQLLLGGRLLPFSVGIQLGREARQEPMEKGVSIVCELANNRIQAVSSATKETI